MRRLALLCGVASCALSSTLARADQVVDGGASYAYPSGPTAFSDALTIGTGTVEIGTGASVIMNTTDGSTASRIEIGNGGTGVLNIDGGTLTVNIADGPTAGTSIGRIWVGGGLNNTTGGVGVLNLSSGLIDFVPEVAGTGNYGGLAIGRGVDVTGTLNQTGGTIRFDSGGAVDLGILGGAGTYNLSGEAVFDASHGGLTMYVGSRPGTGSQASTGSLNLSDDAQFTMTTGENSGGQLYVGDAGSSGTIRQSGNSVVTLGLMNPIRFGSNISNDPEGGGSGTYYLSGGTLNVLNVGGSHQIIFGDAAGGTGALVVSGGTANVADDLIIANSSGSTGQVLQTAGVVSLSNGATLQFGSGTGSYTLSGGVLAIGGINGISGSGTLNFGSGTLRVQESSLTSANAATLTAGGNFTFDTNGLNATWSGVLSGSGALTKVGDGTLTLSAANTYTGLTTISGGTLALAGTGSIGASLVNNGTFDISGVTSLVQGTTSNGIVLGGFSGSGIVINGTNALVVGADNSSSSFSGTIVNTNDGWDPAYGTFAKVGTGTLTIDGATIQHGEAYLEGGTIAQTSGNTTIYYLSVGSGTTNNTPNAGAMNVSGGSLTFETGLQVGDFGGTGVVNQTGGTVTVQDGCGDPSHCASLNIGNQGGTGVYNISGGLLSLNSGIFDIGRNSAGNAASTGTINIDGGSVSLSNGSLVIGDWLAIGSTDVAGTGTINQTAGVFTVNNDSRLYLSGTGHGSYNLTGGTLQIGGNSLLPVYNNFAGGYDFTLGGGTIQVIGSVLTTNANASLASGTTSSIDTNGFGAIWSGVLSGGGTLNKSGNGSLVLTGANTYTGGTTIAGGELAIGNGGTTGSITGDVLDNGQLTFDRSDNTSFGGVISGTGSVLLGGGTGSVALTGINTYAGATTVTSGSTLALTGSGSIASSSGVVANGTFDISGTTAGSSIKSLSGDGSVALGSKNLALTQASGTFSGVIGGSGGLSVTGGTQVLTGTNTYTGGTTIASGVTLQLGSGGTSGSITGNVANNGTLAFNRSNDVTFSGAISGAGSVEKGGLGTLTLSGDNSYSGGTVVSAGTLSLLTDTAAGTGIIVLGDGTTLAYADGIDVANTLNIAGAVSLNVASGQATQSGDLTGTGTYRLTGTGTLHLTGDNRGFAGSTVLSGLTVDLTNSQALGSGGVQVVGNATLHYADGIAIANAIAISTGSALTTDVTAADVATQSGKISGTGSLVKTGGGTLVLTAADNYTGGTTITGGALQLGNGGTGGSITGDIVNNGTLIFDRSDDLGYAGAISGTGMVVQNGSGSVTLSGANSYAGGTELNAGTLIVGASGALGTGTLVMAEGTTLGFAGSYTINNAITVSGDPIFDVAAAQTATINGVVADGSAPGDVVKTGDGTLVLTAANTYTGGTTISAGTLALSGNGGVADAAGVVDNGVFDISATNAGASIKTLSGAGMVALGAQTLTLTAASDTFSGSIAGTGGLALTGGSETLTGANSYSGGTTIANGATLQLGNGGTSGSIAGDVIDNGTLAFNRSDNLAYAGVLSGAGILRQISSGTLTLTGDSSGFTGATEVASGTLAVNGSLGGTLAIDSGATLAGTGKVGTTSVASGGILSPAGGGAIGTLTVNGNLSLAAGSTYAVDVDAAGHSDLVHASGTATIGGAGVLVAASGGWNLVNRYTILTADNGVSGTMVPSITSDFAFLTPSLSNDADNVYLTFVRNGVDFASIAQTRNERSVASALDRVPSGSLLNAVVQLSAADARTAFDSLSGEIHASVQGRLADDSRFARNTAIDRIRSAFGDLNTSSAKVASSDPRGLTFWSSGYGEWGRAGGDGNASSLSDNVDGFFIGADAALPDSTSRAGAFVGYGRSTLTAGSGGGAGSADNYTAGLYGGNQWGPIGLRLGTGYTWSDISINRLVSFTGFQEALSSGYSAGTVQAFGELGYRVELGAKPGAFSLEPFAGMAYVNVHTSGFSERGRVAALSGTSDDIGVGFATFGAHASSHFTVADLGLTASGTVGWRHAYGDVTPTSTLSFAGSDAFSVGGTPIACDAAIIEAGLYAAITRNALLGLSYTGQFGDAVQSQGVRGNLNIKF